MSSCHFLWLCCLTSQLGETSLVTTQRNVHDERYTEALQWGSEQSVPPQGLHPELGLGLQYGSTHQQLTEDANVQLLSFRSGQAGLTGH